MRLKPNMVGKMFLKVEHNDPQKFASKLHGFPYTSRSTIPENVEQAQSPGVQFQIKPVRARP